MWFVYVIKLKNKTLYIGSTNNLVRRLSEHREGLSKFTKNILPFTLEAYVSVNFEKENFIQRSFNVVGPFPTVEYQVMYNFPNGSGSRS